MPRRLTRKLLLARERALEAFQFIFAVNKDLGVRWAKMPAGAACYISCAPFFTEFIDVIVQMVEDQMPSPVLAPLDR